MPCVMPEETLKTRHTMQDASKMHTYSPPVGAGSGEPADGDL